MLLRTSYPTLGTVAWQRWLLEVADEQIGGTLTLPIPESAGGAEARGSLITKVLLSIQWTEHVKLIKPLGIPVVGDEMPESLRCEEAILRLAAINSACDARATASRNSRPLAAQSNPPAKRVRLNPKYQQIDQGLHQAALAKPTNHREVFQFLDNRKVPYPDRIPFKPARGWLNGWLQDHRTATAWLSQRWAKLSLPAFPRGPKK